MIRQHTNDRFLNDLRRFLVDIVRFFSVDHWHVGGLEVTGYGALELEELCRSGHRFSDAEFRRLYTEIYQTIWGRFSLEAAGEEVAVLEAIDSSYWHIRSSDQRFVEHMVDTYGEYRTEDHS